MKIRMKKSHANVSRLSLSSKIYVGVACIIFGYLFIEERIYLKLNSADSTSYGVVSKFNAVSSTSVYDFDDDEEVNFAEKWFNEQRRNHSLILDEEPVRVFHRGVAGLGHNIIRFSATFHFARKLNLKYFYATWNPMCGGGIHDIPTFLFGPGPIIVSPPPSPHFSKTTRGMNNVSFPSGWPKIELLSTNNQTFPNIDVSIINETPGYNYVVDTVLYKRELKNMLNDRNQKYASSLFYGKVDTDVEFYQQLMVLFQGKGRVRDIMTRSKEVIAKLSDNSGINSSVGGEELGFDRYTVFGLHVRTGNGEKNQDFTLHRRMRIGIDHWVNNTVDMLHDYIYNTNDNKHEQYFIDKPPAIFVATDTQSIIDKMRARSIRIPIFSVADFENGTVIEDGGGVTWNKNDYTSKENCLKAWEDMFLDMYLLCKCNTVIAGQYSSFSQAAPLSLILHKAAKRKSSKLKRNYEKTAVEEDPRDRDHPNYFCEVGIFGDNMACYDNFLGWYNRSNSFFIGNATSRPHAHSNQLLMPSKELGVKTSMFSWYDGSAINVTY